MYLLSFSGLDFVKASTGAAFSCVKDDTPNTLEVSYLRYDAAQAHTGYIIFRTYRRVHSVRHFAWVLRQISNRGRQVT